MDYAIASPTTAPWVMGVTMGETLLTLSEHSPLMLSLALPSPLAPEAPAVPTLHAHWEPGA